MNSISTVDIQRKLFQQMGNENSTDNHILTRDFSDELGNKYWAKFDSKPFEEGISRYAFKGILRGSGPKKDKNCVVKVFKEEYAERFEDWVPDLYTSITAKDYARIFTEEVLPQLNLNKKIDIKFILPMMAEVDESTTTLAKSNARKNKTINKKEYVAIEEFIDGKYVKFNSNAGYEDKELSDVMPAFTHWTFQYSEKKVMVCDLQGVKQTYPGGERYILTDPAIHSKDETFGMTDLGAAGMTRVIIHHKCTPICHQLQLNSPLLEFIHIIATRPRQTTYKFDLSESERRMNEMEKRP